jgi:protein phosphatase
MALALHIGRCTLLGNYRENNEDAIDVKQFPDLTVCVVADGMGGQNAGEVASNEAIKVIPRELKKNLTNVTDGERTRQLIRFAVVQANAIIMEMAAMDRDLASMGTTVVLAVWRRATNTIYVANIGDSRAYLVRGSKIEQLTTDHSIAQALVEARTISAADARTHKYRNVLWKFLGSKDVGDGPDVRPVTVKGGDRLLLCTDGLSGVVPDEDILKFMNEHKEAQVCSDGLGQFALDSGSKDNVSCIVIDVAEGN